MVVGRHTRQAVATVNQFFNFNLQRRDLNPRKQSVAPRINREMIFCGFERELL